MLFLIVPIVVLYSTLTLRQFIMHMIPVWLIALIFAGQAGLFLPILGLFFMIPGIVMGRMYKKFTPALRIIFAGGLTALVELLVLLLIATAVFHFSLGQYVRDVIEIAITPLRAMADVNTDLSDVLTPEYIIGLSNYTLTLIPSGLIIASFTMAIITHAISRPLLESMGYSVPRLKPARDWRLPRSLIWYYLIAVFLEIIARANITGVLAAIVLNFMPLVHLAFTIQTIGFVFFWASHRKWGSFLPFVLSIVVVLIPPLRIIGILDLAFPLREYITRPKR
ncbi:DUF2232 domain-containing protein [Paenibacillus hunanensis]|uniref:Uncharacterized protein YybS (DUF2232 family) n=2 Tax=Paenibacillus hunanensis TaxID=539262 RepID=A0ABU1J4F6_9BACL|nr:DUF2232 domain-containing protein [Paenibacillus hunanensis]MCL9663325.1 YybS family protein [Paenibacillus hunanensis]MDR6246386.1 uncharacterized protein YybS (DUF2232 family) [Paenibacillus hunanensis]WPP41387.1 DUF2232 domain-containing protein [Paenibacillus hunanensis]